VHLSPYSSLHLGPSNDGGTFGDPPLPKLGNNWFGIELLRVGSMSIKVIIIEEQTITRFGLLTLIEGEKDIEVVGEFATGQEALDKMAGLQPDVVILDVRPLELSGEQIVEEIHQMEFDPKVIAFSDFDDQEHVMGMLNAGVLGYFLKNEPPKAILEAIRAVTKREPWFSRKALAKVMNFRRSELAERPPLTPRELEVLHLLPKGYTNRQIAETLTIAETTVKNHLTSIYSKLGVKGRAGAIAWAWQHGLVNLLN
jgi:DNA-binding NarL/FixJ family response regulator